jgi:hypothetical protein
MTAMPAPAKEEGVADHRDVVVEPDSFSALGAARRGMDDRFPEGNAVNANVEEASESQTEKNCKDHPYNHLKNSASDSSP